MNMKWSKFIANARRRTRDSAFARLSVVIGNDIAPRLHDNRLDGIPFTHLQEKSA